MSKRTTSTFFIGCLMLLCGRLAFAGGPSLVTRTQAFLDAYARGDAASVLSKIDSAEITIYGSDAAEVFHGGTAVATMIANDQALWGGSAKIGTMQHISIVESKDEASIFFDAPFSVGQRPAVPVRFAMVWRRHNGRWLLAQSSNVVPTQGQSASELLHPAAKQAVP